MKEMLFFVSLFSHFKIKLHFILMNLLQLAVTHGDTSLCHTVTAYAKNGDYILGVVFYPKPSSVSDVAGIQSVHASLN